MMKKSELKISTIRETFLERKHSIYKFFNIFQKEIKQEQTLQNFKMQLLNMLERA